MRETSSQIATGTAWWSGLVFALVLAASVFSSVAMSQAQAPPFFLWAVRAGGTGNDAGHAVIVGTDGGIYVAGLVTAPAQIGNVSLNESGDFLAKYDNSGQIFAKRRKNVFASGRGRARSSGEIPTNGPLC